MDAYLEPEGCEFYCDLCAPDDAEAYPDGGGEADTPQNCAECHQPLGNPLTREGVKYVLETAREELKKGRVEYLKVHPCYKDTYYQRSPHVEITRDWMDQLHWYGLPQKEHLFIVHFLSWTKYQMDKPRPA